MDQQTPKPTQQPQIFFHFLVSGEIEYVETVQRAGHRPEKMKKYLKTNTVFQSPVQGLTAKHLGKCQVNLQMNFHRHYSRTHKNPPEVTNVVILATSFLGVFTEQDFLEGAPTEDQTPAVEPENAQQGFTPPTQPAEPKEATFKEQEPTVNNDTGGDTIESFPGLADH